MSSDDVSIATVAVDAYGQLVAHISNKYFNYRVVLSHDSSLRIARQILAHDIVQSLTVEQLESTQD